MCEHALKARQVAVSRLPGGDRRQPRHHQPATAQARFPGSGGQHLLRLRQAVRCEKPTRAHQAAATRITAMLDAAAKAHMQRNPGTCLDTSSDFDVLLWEVPAATIRSPDAALFDCAPNDLRPLPAFHLKVVVEVVSPGSRKADKLDKMAEYADAGIPFYWLVWLSDDHVLSIDIHVLDHTLGYYRLFRTLTPEQETSTIDVIWCNRPSDTNP